MAIDGRPTTHALSIYEAADICAEGIGLEQADMTAVVQLIAAEYDMTCGYVEERLAFLARHAPRDGIRECPV